MKDFRIGVQICRKSVREPTEHLKTNSVAYRRRSKSSKRLLSETFPSAKAGATASIPPPPPSTTTASGRTVLRRSASASATLQEDTDVFLAWDYEDDLDVLGLLFGRVDNETTLRLLHLDLVDAKTGLRLRRNPVRVIIGQKKSSSFFQPVPSFTKSYRTSSSFLVQFYQEKLAAIRMSYIVIKKKGGPKNVMLIVFWTSQLDLVVPVASAFHSDDLLLRLDATHAIVSIGGCGGTRLFVFQFKLNPWVDSRSLYLVRLPSRHLPPPSSKFDYSFLSTRTKIPLVHFVVLPSSLAVFLTDSRLRLGFTLNSTI